MLRPFRVVGPFFLCSWGTRTFFFHHIYISIGIVKVWRMHTTWSLFIALCPFSSPNQASPFSPKTHIYRCTGIIIPYSGDHTARCQHRELFRSSELCTLKVSNIMAATSCRCALSFNGGSTINTWKGPFSAVVTGSRITAWSAWAQADRY